MMEWQKLKTRANAMTLRLLLTASVALVGALWSFRVASSQPTGYQEYYVMGYEEHVWRGFLGMYDGPSADIPGEICSTVSLVATTDFQVIIYDHWEDGYEADPFNPSQISTETYGDGNLLNGGIGQDLLHTGDDLALASDQNVAGSTVITGYVPVDPTRDPTVIRYDGRDRVISSGGPINLAHAMWPLDNSWVGGAWEMYSRQTHSGVYSYRLPIGVDLYPFGGGDNGIYGDFRHAILEIGSFEDNTVVSIANGTEEVNLTLDQGDAYSSLGYVNSYLASPISITLGTRIRSSKSAQVGLITGGDSGTALGFQGRFLMLLSDQQWGADYVVPVPSGAAGDRAEVYVANPNDFPIVVTAHDTLTSTSFVINPTGDISATIPYSTKRGTLGHIGEDSAVRFSSSDGVFGIVVAADTSDTSYDWGFSAVPTRDLDKNYFVPWAPGTTDLSDNGSPVWVTPRSDGTLFFVDYSPLDGVADESFVLDVLQQRRIFDPDNDNTGMHVWASGEFGAAWGADPRTSGPGDPYLDLGVSILPLQRRWLDPVLTLDKTAFPSALPATGGVVSFTLVAEAHGVPVTRLNLTDTLPLNWSYVLGSTHVAYPDGSWGTPEPSRLGNRLRWDLAAAIALNQSLTLTFQAEITQTGGITRTAFDGFESNGYDAGDNWAARWQEFGDDGNPTSGNVRVDSANAPHTGNYHLVIGGAGSGISRTVDLSNFVRPTLRFMRRTDALAAGDQFYLDISNGLIWTPVFTWTQGDFDSTYVGEVVDLTEFAATSTSLRFRSDSSAGPSGRLYADEIQVFESIGVSVNRAQAVGEDPYSHLRFSPGAEATVSISSIQIEKTVSEQFSRIGNTLVYTVSYLNQSDAVTATNVLLMDPLPIQFVTYSSSSVGGAYDPVDGAVTWALGTLPPRASGTVTASVIVNDFVAHDSLVENTALVKSDQTRSRSNPVRTQINAPRIVFTKSGPSTAAPGQLMTYTIYYENIGGSAATNTIITDMVVPVLSYVTGTLAINTGSGWMSLSDAIDEDQGAFVSGTLSVRPGATVSTIAAGETGQIRFAARVHDGAAAGSLVFNTASIDRDLDIPRESNTVVTRIADLVIWKAAAQTVVQSSGVVSYSLVYLNASQSSSHTSIYVLEPVPNFTRLEPNSIFGGDSVEYSWDNGVSWTFTLPISPVTHIRWFDAELTPSDQASVGFAVRVSAVFPPGTSIRNTARITSTETAAYAREWLRSNEIEVGTVGLWIEKQASHTEAEPGAVVSYTIDFGNRGTHDVIGASLRDTLPVSTSYRLGSIWGRGADDSGAPTLVWEVMTVTASSSVESVGYSVVFSKSLPAFAVVTNTATVSSAFGLESGDPVTTIVVAPLLSMAATADTAFIEPGERLTYTIRITNSGFVARRVLLTDVVPLDTAFLGCSGAPCTLSADTVVWGPFDLSGGGQTANAQLVVAVNERLQNGSQIVNSDYQIVADNAPRLAGQPVTTTVVAPALALNKWASSSIVAPGERLSYTLRVTNSGYLARDLVISDIIPNDATFAQCGGTACVLTDSTVVWGPNELGGAGSVLDLTLVVTVGEGLPNGWVILNDTYRVVARHTAVINGPPVTNTVNVPNLALYKWALQDEVFAGSRLDYALMAANSGSQATHLVISDTLPADTWFGGCDCTVSTLQAIRSPPLLMLSSQCGPSFTCGSDGRSVVWSVDQLNSGSAMQMTFWVTADAGLPEGALIVNDSYEMSAHRVDPIVGSPPVTTVVRRLGLSISKRAWPDPVKIGQILRYTITLDNQGGGLASLQVTDVIPNGVSFVDCGGALCEGVGGADREVQWWIPHLDANAVHSLTLRVAPHVLARDAIVNDRYSVWIEAARKRLVGLPVSVAVLDPYLYASFLPIMVADRLP